MKWSQYKEKASKELFEKARLLCEEIHDANLQKKSLAARGCRFCYKKEGKICFPCTKVKEKMMTKYDLSC